MNEEQCTCSDLYKLDNGGWRCWNCQQEYSDLEVNPESYYSLED